MALTELEQELVQSIKEQGWTRSDATSMLNKFRAKQKQEAEVWFETITQEARRWLEDRVTPAPQLPEEETSWPGIIQTIKETPWNIITDIAEWGFTLWEDITKIQAWRLEDTKWLLWDFLKAWEWSLERIKELNDVIDATWWTTFDKVIWTWLNIFWAWVDFTWDVIVAWLKTLAPEWLEKATAETIEDFKQTDFWKWVIDFIKTWSDKVEDFKNSSPEAKRLVLSIKSVLPVWEVVTWWVWAKIVKEAWEELIETWIKLWKKQKEKVTTKLEERKELKKEALKEERIRTTAQILQAWDSVSDSTLETIWNFITKSKSVKDIKESLSKSAREIITKRNDIIQQANKKISNTLLLTKSLVDKVDNLKAEWLVSPRVIKKYEERLNMEKNFLKENKDTLDLVWVESRKEKLNKLTERLQKKKDAWTLTDLENAELQALDLVRDWYKVEIENITDTFFAWTDNVWSVKSLNKQFWDLQTWITLLKKEASKIRKSEDPAWFIRDKLSKLPVIWEFVKTPGVSSAIKREELLKGKTKILEKTR